MIKKVLISALLVYCCFTFAQNIASVSILDCYTRAINNHTANADIERVAQIEKLRSKNIKSEWLPKLSINGQATYQSEAISIDLPIPSATGAPIIKHLGTSPDQYKATLDVNQLIYDGGYSSASKQINYYSSLNEVSQLKLDIQKLKEQINQIFFGILLINKNIELLNVTLSNLNEKQRQIEISVKNGLLTEIELKVIKIEIIKLENLISDLTSKKFSSIDVLNQLSGMVADTATLFEIPNNQLTVLDTILRPELEIISNQRIITDYQKRIYTSQLMPKVSLFAQEGYGKPGLNMLGNSFNDFYVVGVNLRWTIWDWQKTSRDRQILGLQRENINSKEILFLRNINTAKTQLNAQINQLIKSIASDEMIVNLQNELLTLYSKRLENGIITSTEYINTLNAYHSAKLNAESNKIKLIQTQYELKTLLGN